MSINTLHKGDDDDDDNNNNNNKPFTPAGSASYAGTEAISLLKEEAGNRVTEKLTRQVSRQPSRCVWSAVYCTSALVTQHIN